MFKIIFDFGQKKKKNTRVVKRKGKTSLAHWNWLYPLYGMGCFVVLLSGLWIYFYFGHMVDETNRWALNKSQQLDLTLQDLVVVGRNRTTQEDVLQCVGMGRSDPLYAADPQAIKESLEQSPWVEAAFVQRRLPHTLFIYVEEHIPMALWQYQGKYQLIDTKGHVIEGQNPRSFSNLIKVVGKDAASHAPQLIQALADFPELKHQITAATHQHGQRWDMRIKDKIDVKLPEEDLSAALQKLQEIDNEYDFSQGEIMTIDMRFPDKLILRLTHEAIRRNQAPGRDA